MPQQMGANHSLRRRHPGRLEGIGKHGPDEGRLPERPMRRPQGDEQMLRGSGPPVPDVVDDRFADVDRQRHAVVQAALSADRQLSGPPVEVRKPNLPDLLRPQPETGQQQHDCAIAQPGRAAAADGGDQPADLLGRKAGRCAVPAPARDHRNARSQIAAGGAGGEHEPEQPAKLRRPVCQAGPASRNGGRQSQEGPDLLRPDAVQVARLRSEDEAEKAPDEPPAVGGRGAAQPPLPAQPVSVVGAQLPKPVRRRRLILLRSGDGAGGGEMIREPGDAGAPAAARIGRARSGHRVLELRQRRGVDVAGAQAADRDLLAKQVDGVLIMPDRAGGAAQPLKLGQKRLPMRDQPAGGGCLPRLARSFGP